MVTSKAKILSMAKGYLTGHKHISGTFLLSAAIGNNTLSKDTAAEILKIQYNQLGKWSNPSSGRKDVISPKAGKRLAKYIVDHLTR